MTVRPPSPDLAIAALVLGIVSIALSPIVVGALFALVGLTLGTVYVRRHRAKPRGMAVSGMVLAGVGFVASAGFGTLYYAVFSKMLGINGLSANHSALTAWVGVQAPDFTVTTLDGEVLELSKLKGRRVVVDFWATWCEPCIQEVPHFNRLAEENSADELLVIAISKEPRDVIEPFVNKHAMVFPVASADGLPAPYSLISAIPTKLFIDRQGVIQSVVLGASGFESLEQQALAEDYADEVRSAPAQLAGAIAAEVAQTEL